MHEEQSVNKINDVLLLVRSILPLGATTTCMLECTHCFAVQWGPELHGDNWESDSSYKGLAAGGI